MGVSADPLVIFSTSQANIAALSHFLAMGWSAGERSLPFVLLDDPVQSMDDVNVLGFADPSRHLRTSRQLIISTHERRFAGLLERKLAPRSATDATLVLEFLGWDRSGRSATQTGRSRLDSSRPCANTCKRSVRASSSLRCSMKMPLACECTSARASPARPPGFAEYGPSRTPRSEHHGGL